MKGKNLIELIMDEPIINTDMFSFNDFSLFLQIMIEERKGWVKGIIECHNKCLKTKENSAF